jgi:tetratricopeptide (TPR) repeat protein
MEAILEESGAGGMSAEPMEVRELAGGLVGIQRYLSHVETKWDFADLVNRSAEMVRRGDHKGALQVTDEILRHNEYHTAALLNRAGALTQLREYHDALRLVIHASEIEPNLPTFAIVGVDLALAIGSPRHALRMLSKMLDRWRYHYPIWLKLVETATAHDLCEGVDSWLDLGLNIVTNDKIQTVIAESRARSSQFKKVLSRAYEAQQNGDWQLGLSLCREARQITKSNSFAILNEHVCKYWLSMRGNSWSELISIVHELWGPPQLSALLLLFLDLVESGSIEKAKEVAGMLAALIEDPIDLPRLPTIITEECLQEDLPLEPITQSLQRVLDEGGLHGDQGTPLKELLEKYHRLEVLTEEAAEK